VILEDSLKFTDNKIAIPVNKPLTSSRLGGVVVSVLATGPKGCGFKPGQGDGFFRAKKSTAHLLLDGK
jgi:hypothetical protein